MTRVLWLCAGWVCVGLAALGVILPLMPTVVFLIVAAYAFSKSSPRFHTWLLTHPTFGPPLNDWLERGAISRNSKIAASIAILASFVLAWALGAPNVILAVQVLILGLVLVFILTRPGD